jgi:hypothetical protein
MNYPVPGPSRTEQSVRPGVVVLLTSHPGADATALSRFPLLSDDATGAAYRVKCSYKG